MRQNSSDMCKAANLTFFIIIAAVRGVTGAMLAVVLANGAGAHTDPDAATEHQGICSSDEILWTLQGIGLVYGLYTKIFDRAFNLYSPATAVAKAHREMAAAFSIETRESKREGTPPSPHDDPALSTRCYSATLTCLTDLFDKLLWDTVPKVNLIVVWGATFFSLAHSAQQVDDLDKLINDHPEWSLMGMLLLAACTPFQMMLYRATRPKLKEGWEGLTSTLRGRDLKTLTWVSLLIIGGNNVWAFAVWLTAMSKRMPGATNLTQTLSGSDTPSPEWPVISPLAWGLYAVITGLPMILCNTGTGLKVLSDQQNRKLRWDEAKQNRLTAFAVVIAGIPGLITNTCMMQHTTGTDTQNNIVKWLIFISAILAQIVPFFYDLKNVLPLTQDTKGKLAELLEKARKVARAGHRIRNGEAFYAVAFGDESGTTHQDEITASDIIKLELFGTRAVVSSQAWPHIEQILAHANDSERQREAQPLLNSARVRENNGGTRTVWVNDLLEGIKNLLTPNTGSGNDPERVIVVMTR